MALSCVSLERLAEDLPFDCFRLVSISERGSDSSLREFEGCRSSRWMPSDTSACCRDMEPRLEPFGSAFGGFEARKA